MLNEERKKIVLERTTLNDAVDEKLKQYAIQIIQINRETDKFKKSIDQYISFLEGIGNSVENQKTLINKMNAVKRIMNAAKMGIDRQRLKMYDVDQMTIRNQIAKELSNA